MNDRRAVAGLVGAVLLFGILVISLSLYQAQVVPSENQRTEFEHSQHVQNQMEDVRNALLRTAWSGNSQPTSVTLGTRYPSRTVAVNPPPATGRLATEELGTIRITDVTAASGPEGLREYLDSRNNTLTYDTSALVYAPDYNEYRSAPRTVYENTLLYNNFTSGSGNRYLPLTGDSLVSGDRVSLVVLTGEYSENGVGSATVDPEAVSTPRGGVSVNGSLNVSLPTRYDGTGTTWSDLLPTAASESGGRVNVSTVGDTRLRIGAVSVGSGATSEPAYITAVSQRRSGDGVYTLTARVNDEYLNPRSGTVVNASAASGSITRPSRTSGADGEVAFEYEPPDTPGTYDVDVWFGPNGTDGPRAQWETFGVTVPDQTGGGGGGTGSGGTGSGDQGGPAINWRLDDLSNPNQDRVNYVASYSVTNTNSSFDHVEVAFNDNDGSAQGTEQSTATRGGVEYTAGNGAKDSWDVTLKVVYASGGSEYVAASRQFTDTADAINPTSNANLGDAGSPTIGSFDVTDDSTGSGPEYTISYGVANTGRFSHVRGALLSTGSGGYDIKRRSASSGSIDLRPNYGDSFVTKLLVYDDDGVVVAYAATEPDQADGNDPARAT
ncbi:hypothetical protein J2752_000688 [Halarchaeum rubridurum]|uniref:Uncharacterized protein n=1 Tax=Halarchaeum rubridurum TaxID=489911 RepID=A0A830FNG6_9EURY|nr:hypothetical protein [Halarchaeum rubridurum]MBP1953807.1 hypothetical protein [Halarchaeum rubridurum]GGM54856.1 hypothetical protein GCM10009017_01470 [Halarchaeum rubridurum]